MVAWVTFQRTTRVIFSPIQRGTKRRPRDVRLQVCRPGDDVTIHSRRERLLQLYRKFSSRMVLLPLLLLLL